MARPLRVELKDAVYHLRARGNEKRAVFRDEQDRGWLVKLLERSCARYQVPTLGCVLMSNHFHLLAQTHPPNLSRSMYWLMVQQQKTQTTRM